MTCSTILLFVIYFAADTYYTCILMQDILYVKMQLVMNLLVLLVEDFAFLLGSHEKTIQRTLNICEYGQTF